jgi:predicted  nucleic acid-binding Zn-ribbon protein
VKDKEHVMQTKKYLYAAVGAQVSIAKAAQAKVEEMREKLAESAQTFTKDAQKRVTEWATEGEDFVSKLSDTSPIEDLAARVDFDQMQTQVNRLRDQLEDLMSTWRTNFRPTGKEEQMPAGKVEVEVAPAEKPAAKPAAKKPATKKPPTKTTAAKTTAAKPAAKKPPTKTTAAKTTAAKPAAKKPPTKTTAATKAS